MKNLVILPLVLVTIFSCNSKKNIPESLVGIKEIVAQLDSIVIWEPRDTTANAAIDSLFGDSMQSARVEARATWAKFKRLCDEDNYEAALDFYFADKPDNDGHNSGDFFVHLNHSKNRFSFLTEVLLPLMTEYRGTEFARKQYIDLLQTEKELEDITIDLGIARNGYIPEVYPRLIGSLGIALVEDGKFYEAYELADDIIMSTYAFTGYEIYANFIGAQYVASLFLYQGEKGPAIGIWEKLKQFIDETEDGYDPEMLMEVRSKIQSEIESIQE